MSIRRAVCLQILPFLLSAVLSVAAWASSATPVRDLQGGRIRLGSEVLLDGMLDSLRGKRIGLVMNATSRLGGSEGTQAFLVDSLLSLGFQVTRLIALEHGIRGEAEAGEWIRTGVDAATGLPIASLYGNSKRPTADTFEGLDLVLFDVQDVGARFYTYLSALGLILEAAEAYGIPLWVLDRPNPAGGEYVSGWMMDEKHASYVGMFPIPMVHGMTLGELARMMAGEGWIDTRSEPLFRVVPMQGWRRGMRWPQTGLRWIPPSPNLPSFEHAFVYLGTCLAEGTSLSEGRGTEDPFLLIGSPHLPASAPDVAVRAIRSVEGAELEWASFTPVRIPGKAEAPKHMGKEVNGVRIALQDASSYDPVVSGLDLVKSLMRSSPSDSVLPFLLLLAGSDEITEFLGDDRDAADIDFGTDGFKTARQPYLLYP
jgi:uncharacterized protein YbbC (DUF1343 family)